MPPCLSRISAFSRPNPKAHPGRVSPEGGWALAVGHFDGLHKGHQQLLQQLRLRATQRRCPAALLVLEPMSDSSAAPQPPRLMSWREKMRALTAEHLDHIVTLPCDAHVQSLTADAFVEQFIVGALPTRHLLVGETFRFGLEALGTPAYLRAAGAIHGFSVEQIAPVTVAGAVVTNSLIGELLSRGNLDHAAQLLGRRYRMSGRVVHGNKLGRTLGFPTANIRLLKRGSLLWGICAVLVHGVASIPLNGVASIGTRPTVNGSEPLLEVHVFDFDGDLYGRIIEVEFVAKLRDELRFESLDALVTQMNIDAGQARASLGAAAGPGA